MVSGMKINMEKLTKIRPDQPFGADYDDRWYEAAINEGRAQLLDPVLTYHACFDLDSVDLTIAELKAAIISAPAFMTIDTEDFSETKDATIACYFARILLAGKSGVYGLPRPRAANAN